MYNITATIEHPVSKTEHFDTQDKAIVWVHDELKALAEAHSLTSYTIEFEPDFGVAGSSLMSYLLDDASEVTMGKARISGCREES